MNILISSAMLAVALLMISHSISELRPVQKPVKKTKPVRKQKCRAPADWDRIMKETELEKTKKKAAPHS